MSSKTDNSGSGTDLPISTSYEMGFGDSDVESLSTDTSVNEVIPKDYWFGRKYFECVIAQDLVQHTRLYENVTSIDSRLEKGIHTFPYEETLNELRLRGLDSFLPITNASLCEPYRSAMTCIGAIVRNGDRTQKATLLEVIRRCTALRGSNDHARARRFIFPNAVETDRTSFPFIDTENDNSAPPVDLGRHATALKEYGDQHGFVAEYSVSQLSTVPPVFRASVMFDGHRFEGVARNKKLARHQAASEACTYLGLQRERM